MHMWRWWVRRERTFNFYTFKCGVVGVIGVCLVFRVAPVSLADCSKRLFTPCVIFALSSSKACKYPCFSPCAQHSIQLCPINLQQAVERSLAPCAIVHVWTKDKLLLPV